MGFTTGTGTSNPSGTHEFIPSVHGVCVDLSNVFFSVICWSDILHAATGQEVALTWTCDFNEIEDNFTINALIVKNFIKVT
jgi:hypothetical protein